jgi:hypothetical protein
LFPSRKYCTAITFLNYLTSSIVSGSSFLYIVRCQHENCLGCSIIINSPHPHSLQEHRPFHLGIILRTGILWTDSGTAGEGSVYRDASTIIREHSAVQNYAERMPASQVIGSRERPVIVTDHESCRNQIPSFVCLSVMVLAYLIRDIESSSAGHSSSIPYSSNSHIKVSVLGFVYSYVLYKVRSRLYCITVSSL